MRFLWCILHITSTLVCYNRTQEWVLGVKVSSENPRLFLFLSFSFSKCHDSSHRSLKIFKNTRSKVLSEGLVLLRKAKRTSTLKAISLTLPFFLLKYVYWSFYVFLQSEYYFWQRRRNKRTNPMNVSSSKTKEVEVRRPGVIPCWWKGNVQHG